MKAHCNGCTQDEAQSVYACHIVNLHGREWKDKVFHQPGKRNRIGKQRGHVTTRPRCICVN